MQANIAQQIQQDELQQQCPHDKPLMAYVISTKTNRCHLVNVKCLDCGSELHHPLIRKTD